MRFPKRVPVLVKRLLIVVLALVFVPGLFVWLSAGFVRRRRRNQPVLTALPLLSRPGAIVFWVGGYVGLALVSVVYVAAMVSTSTDEHAAPVLGVWLLFGLFLTAATDLAAQGTAAALKGTLLHSRRR